MRSGSNERRRRIDTREEESPSTGWREVYAAMDISSDADVEEGTPTDQ